MELPPAQVHQVLQPPAAGGAWRVSAGGRLRQGGWDGGVSLAGGSGPKQCVPGSRHGGAGGGQQRTTLGPVWHLPQVRGGGGKCPAAYAITITYAMVNQTHTCLLRKYS